METRFQRNLVVIVLSLLHLGFYSIAVTPTSYVVSTPRPTGIVSTPRPTGIVSTPRPTDWCEAGERGDRECRAKNAICIESEEENYGSLSSSLKPYKCVCAKGMDFLSGDYCRELLSFCEDNGAERNIIRSGSACICPFNEFFDYNIFQCQPLDHCPLLNCTGKYEECVGSKCVCKTEYERRDGKCKPIDYCSLSNICGKAKCKPGPDDDPKDVRCYCDNGFLLVRSGSQLRCKPIQCETPALNACDQTCDYTENDNAIECGCFPGHQMQSDGITCKLKATNKCVYNSCSSSAVCVHIQGTKSKNCYCKKGFKKDADGSCVDICEASNSTIAICPEGCISTLNGFRCICGRKYRQSSNGITCEEKKMCSLDELGYKDCKKKNRTCMERPDTYAGYECGDCLNGLSTFKGICTSLCEVEEYKSYCERRRAKCIDVDGQSRKVRCQCPSLLTMDPEMGCVFANHSYTVTLVLLNRYAIENSSVAEDNNLDWRKLEKDIKQSFTAVYGRALSQANVIRCSPMLLSDLWCRIELQFYFDPFTVNFSSRLYNSEVCKETAFTENGYCFIPPFLIARKNSISSMSRSNPCDSDYGGSVCPQSTVCHREGVGYSCSCKAGYKAIGEVYVSPDGQYTIQICDDIDECSEKPCPAGTGCRNIPGDYRCDCLPGYRRRVNVSNSKTICDKICQPDTCKHGSCNWVDSVGIECKCPDGYAGKYCDALSKESEEKFTNKHKALLIAFGGVEGILLLPLLVGFIVLFKKRKSSSNAVEMTNNSAPFRQTPHINGTHLTNISSAPLRPSKIVTPPKIPSNEELDEPIYVDCGQIPEH